jgi:hypothetical protein
MSQTASIEQLDPQGNWRAFARRHPAAAKAINAQARANDRNNEGVTRTQSHRVAGALTRWNDASVLRSNIASGYFNDSMWSRIAPQWTSRQA